MPGVKTANAGAPVREALGSCLTNEYSEGLPGARYYGGNVHIDALEREFAEPQCEEIT